MGTGALTWILDDGPLGHLALAVSPDQLNSWEPGRVRAASATLDAAKEKDARHTLSLVAATTSEGTPVIAECAVLHGADDPASRILYEFHGPSVSTKNLAEREAIAWALIHDVTAIFVSADKRAVLSALAELGRGRVAHPFDVWLDILDRGWVDQEQFDDLCLTTRKHDQGLERMPSRIRDRLAEHSSTNPSVGET